MVIRHMSWKWSFPKDYGDSVKSGTIVGKGRQIVGPLKSAKVGILKSK